jgi:GNAT superfamily N-acetyltransferase
MELIAAQADDAERIAELHAESWRVHYRGFYRDDYLDGPVNEDRLQVWRGRLNEPSENQLVLIAAEGDDYLGFACAYGGHEAPWGTLLDNLHVRAQRQRNGTGRALLVAVAKWSTERYPDVPLHLWVLEGNTRARAFYDRMGGHAVEERTSPAPGGGSINGLRYVWEGVSLTTLAEAG